MSGAHAADTDYLVRQAMNTGYQWSSLIVPPAYIAYVVARRGRADLSINRVLRATWVGGLSAVSGGGAYLRYAYSGEEAVRMKRIETAYNTSILRRNDHSTIGGVLAAVLTPAILWKRASAVNLILGGAGLGSGVGVLTHYGRTVSGDPPSKVEVIQPVAAAE
ncbi:hypothetical protein BDZ97DRAFT_1653399 [Flammula alnicola]|nr:hypothetical protein BDZ97DRAFT_1653399 [Flammula alnicola]